MFGINIVEWIILIAGFFIAIKIAMSGKGKNEIISEVKARIEGKGRDADSNIKLLNTTSQVWISLSLIGVVAQYHPIRIAIAIAFAILIAIWVVLGFLVALLLLLFLALAATYMVARYFIDNAVEIKAKPPHLGLLTVLGKRPEKDVVLSEGYALRVPPIIDFINLDVEKVNLDFRPVEKVYSAGNVQVELKGVSVLYVPDRNRLVEFIDIGGKKGVNDALEDIIPDVLRIWAKEFDVDDLLKAKKKAEKKILEALVSPNELKEVKDELPEEDMAKEMRKKLKNGIPDDQFLGVSFLRVTVGTVDPIGEYGKHIDKVKTEELQKVYEYIEKEAESDQAELLQERAKKAGDPISFKEAYKLVVDYKALREGRTVIPGLSDMLSSGVSVVEVLKLLRGEKK